MPDPLIDTIRATPAHLADVYREALDDLANALAVERARHEQTRAELEAARQERDIAEQVAARAGASRATVAELTAEREQARAALVEVQAERDSLSARVREMAARPVLTCDALGIALAATERDGRALGDIVADVIAKLGPVTLPAQDRAEELVRELASEGFSIRPWANVGDIVRAALAKVGAPAASPPPADVFAGVSVDELINAYMVAYTTSRAGDTVANRVGIEAVLDAIRVRLVAPVDPDEFAQALAIASGSPGSRPYTKEAIRSTLDTRRIPVTEAGK